MRQHIVDQAKRHSGNPTIQEDLIQEAWLIVSTAPGDSAIYFLKKLAFVAIHSAYWQERKEQILIREKRRKRKKMRQRAFMLRKKRQKG